MPERIMGSKATIVHVNVCALQWFICMFIVLKEKVHFYFSPDHELPIVEWEHLPHIGPRPLRGFVGLKNAGATCYMNAVLQQLYMIPPVRKGILDVEEPARQLRQLEEEESRREKEREANRRNREEVRLELVDYLSMQLSSPIHAAHSSCWSPVMNSPYPLLPQTVIVKTHTGKSSCNFSQSLVT